MKRKLLFAAMLIAGALGTLRAQTDVTSTYITNASFESDGAITASGAALTITGWTQSNPGTQYNNTGCYDASTNLSTQGTVTVTPSAGDYCLFFRHGWNGSGAAYTFTSSSTTLPAGSYTLSVDYKMVEGYDDTQKNTTKVTIAAKSGENTLGSADGTTKTNVQGGNSYTYLNTANWSTATANFTLEESTANVQFVITLFAGGQRRSDFVLDNVKLLQTAFIDPTAIALEDVTMIPTATKTLSVTYTPAESNHNTTITWESLDETVATVTSEGVVTAVAAGTTTITATTANSVSTTCTVTVNPAPIANGYYYLYNEGAGKYVVGANNWGTRASMETSGIKMTATLSGGKYTLSTAPTYTSSYLGVDGYVDQGSAEWYLIPASEDGYIMQCSSNSKYLVWDGNSATTTSMTETLPTDSKGYWTFKSSADRLAVLETATKASPKEATYLIGNPDFSRNANLGLWTYTSSKSSEFKVAGGDHINNNLQQWDGYCTVYQDVTNLPKGLYKMTVQGFYRPGGSATTSTAQNVTIYAGEEEELLMLHTNGAPSSEDADNGFTADTGLGSWVPNTQTDASKAFTAGYYVNEVDNILTTNGTIRIGAKNTTTLGSQWMVIDNFRLYYYGPTISSTAVELPGGSLTADTWYYFDVVADGDYDLTVTTLSDVVYTTDAKVLVEDGGSVVANFATKDELALTAGRYYIKSASAQSFAVAPHAYTYAVGDATLSVGDGGYTQSSTFTVTFPDAATNDPGASVALVASSKATVNGNEVALSAVTNGFSLDLGSLTANTDYRIVIPADVYGYAGESMNATIDITIHTPAAFDGFYFLRTSTGKYVARGGDYNSRAVVDEFGLPLSVATDASGITQFTYVDNGGKLFLNGSGNAFTDNDTDPNWTFEATEGGYYIVHADGTYANKKLNVWSGDGKALFATGTEGEVFVIEPVSEHNTYMEALKDAQAATAATAYGITGITTKAALASWLEANCNPEAVVSVPSVVFTEKWNGDASAEWGAGKDMYTNTISNLPAGLYKLTVNAYYRINGSATAAEGARGNTYVYGGTAKTQLYSVHEFPASTPWVNGNDQQDDYGYYPNNTEGGAAALTAGNYLNELYVYHTGGDFTYGIHQPSRFSNNEWFGFQNFTLTGYDYIISEDATTAPLALTDANVQITRTFKGGQWNGFSVPFDFTVAGSALEGAEVKQFSSVTDNEITLEDATAIVAGEPYLVKPATDDIENPTFNGVNVTNPEEAVKGTGSYTFQAHLYNTELATDGSVAYVSTTDSSIKKLTSGGIKGLRAIFNIPTGSGVKALRVNFDSTTTGVLTVDAEGNIAEGTLYNLAGQRVQKAQKGLYIQNGKKVIMK